MFLRGTKVIYIFAASIKLLILIKITDNCFNSLMAEPFLKNLGKTEP